MVQNGPYGPTRPKIVHNGHEQSRTVQKGLIGANDQKQSKMVQNCPKWS